MKADYRRILERARSRRKLRKQQLARLNKVNDRQLDAAFHELHDEAFRSINCLDCANCCKSTGPLFTRKDIERISRHLNLKPAAMIETYLRVDEDDDYVLKQVPCTFLNADNTCRIYDIRPKACREYPHTDRSKQKQILNLANRNAEICPAVSEILKSIDAKLGL